MNEAICVLASRSLKSIAQVITLLVRWYIRPRSIVNVVYVLFPEPTFSSCLFIPNLRNSSALLSSLLSSPLYRPTLKKRGGDNVKKVTRECEG